jgi:tetratricopeptide (TPR) repeat protein
MGPIEVVAKPLTPSKFLPGFRNLLTKWETRQYLALRMGIHQYLRHGQDAGHNSMKKLLGLDEIFPLVAQNMSLIYRAKGSLGDAEKILLHALKKNPKDLGLMLALGDLYLKCSMPKMAYRLFQGARIVYGDSMAIFPDLAQAAMLLGELHEAANILLTMYRKEFRVDDTLDFLTRVQMADGRIAEAEKALANKKGHFRKLFESWNQASSDQLPEAG